MRPPAPARVKRQKNRRHKISLAFFFAFDIYDSAAGTLVKELQDWGGKDVTEDRQAAVLFWLDNVIEKIEWPEYTRPKSALGLFLFRRYESSRSTRRTAMKTRRVSPVLAKQTQNVAAVQLGRATRAAAVQYLASPRRFDHSEIMYLIPNPLRAHLAHRVELAIAGHPLQFHAMVEECASRSARAFDLIPAALTLAAEETGEAFERICSDNLQSFRDCWDAHLIMGRAAIHAHLERGGYVVDALGCEFHCEGAFPSSLSPAEKLDYLTKHVSERYAGMGIVPYLVS